MTARVALVAKGLSARQLALAGLSALVLAAGLTQALTRTGAAVFSGAGAVRASAGASDALAGLSPAARASISAALGAEQPAYHFLAATDGFRALNPDQHLGLDAGRAGVLVRSPGLRLAMSLRAVGYGSSLGAVNAVGPSAASNTVTYDHAGIGEWYVNGPLGLEQGFTLAHAPARGGATAGPLTLAIAVSGNTRASLATGGQSVTFSGAHGGSLRYGGLSVRDASGRILRSWLALGDGELLLRIDARGARYPLRIDPTVEGPAAKLSPAGGEGEGAGLSVALAADGNTALVGAPNAEVEGGIVWVFTRQSGSEWVKSGELTMSATEGEASECVEGSEDEPIEEGNECGFGASVALSADGDTALIGAPRMSVQVPARHPLSEGETESIAQAGAAWVFTRSQSGWTEAAELTSPERDPNAHFGRSVALAGNGEAALVGAPAEHAGDGRAWMFQGSGTSWSVQGGALAGTGEQGEGHFGRSVALSGDGRVALIGAPGDSDYLGGAWVYERSESGWTERGPVLEGAGEAPEGHFGSSVALSEDGATALVGARDDAGKGAAWVFAQSGSTWSEQGSKLTGGGEEGEQFGYSVALSASGNSAIVGAPHAAAQPIGAAHPIAGRGLAWLYERTGTSWGAAVRKLEGGAKQIGNARFGTSVAMSPDDGETVLVGGPSEDGKSGAAWVFGPGPSVESVSPKKGTTLGGTKVTIRGGHLLGAMAVRFGSTPVPSFEVHKLPDEETITTEAPEGTGTVDVTVETPFGTSAVGASDQYTYVPPGHKGGKEKETEQHQGGGNGNEQPSGGTSNNESPGTGTGTGTGAAIAVLAAGPTAGGACGASLLSKKIAVGLHSRAVFKLVGTGAGKCSGKLRLRVKLKLGGGRFKLKTIGTAVFSISSGRRVSVSVKLNAAGRALLAAGHGGLNASVLLVKQSPTPYVSHTASVRLARPRPKPKP
jgi:hypothetical protein